MDRLPTRQVHLDFHTSECIPGVGSRFSTKDFQKALTTGRLNSITVFAKCHHGWCYYPTEVGMAHPTLDVDLTGAMIEAAHEIGVRAPIYITVGWSAADAENHPEWCARDREGKLIIRSGDTAPKPTDPRPYTSWVFMCPNTPYGAHVAALTREICARYPVDGIFYDINFRPLCFCPACLDGMKRDGLDPQNDEDVQAHSTRMWLRFTDACRAAVFEKHPGASVFFNGGANVFLPQFHECHTHFELEDLPTTWGGYDKFPPRARFFGRTGKDCLAMSGKFHTSWGEFGGYKNPEALRYECAAMLAFGARCSIGDQMPPVGKMDMDTYKLIGHAYKYVEQIEPWCYDEEETTRLGFLMPSTGAAYEGLARALLEAQLDFDVALPADDFGRYDALVLPDCVTVDDELAAKLNAFAANGGGLLLSGTSGMDVGETRFLVDVGADATGPALYRDDYVAAGREIGKGLVMSPVFCYRPARRVSVTDGEVLAAVHEPYFDRTYAHYCSHRNTPPRPRKAGHPAAVRKGSTVYLAHPIFSIYHEFGAQIHRDYALNALKLVYTDPVLQVDMPSAGRVRFVRQPKDNRYVLHLLYASPIRRGIACVIEDLPTLRRVKARLRVEQLVRRVALEPQGKEIPFKQTGDVVTLTVPSVTCHQIVSLTF